MTVSLASAIFTATSQRLKGYHLFSNEVIREVAQCAESQAGVSYQDWFKQIGLPKVKLYTTKRGRTVPYITIAARNKSTKTLVINLPMGNSLDASQLYQLATIAAVIPECTIVAFGNPSGKPFHFKRQKLSLKELFEVAFTSRRRAVVASELEYIDKHVKGDVYYAGYSYGALKALLEATYTTDTRLKGIILVDPVAHPRYRRQLLENFIATLKPMGEYVDRTGIDGYFAARKDAAETVNYNAGLRRPINIAIGMMLAKADFAQLFEAVLQRRPSLYATVAWASKSELGNDAHMGVTSHRLSHEYPHVQAMRLDGDKHSVANDIHLHAAIIREALNAI